ncbi:alpha/beta hydrolase [Nitrospira sp. Ecomares 2.1]
MIHPHQQLFRLRTRDGVMMNGHLVIKENDLDTNILKTPIVIEVHGLLGNFLARGTPRLLPQALRERNISSFSINTRLAFAGQINGRGIFDETIHDIDAAVHFLTQEGFSNIFILGYSLGASMVLHWAGHRQVPTVKGLILEGTHYAIPDTQRKRLAKWESTPSYEELYAQAKSILGENPSQSDHDEMVVIYQARGPSRSPLHDEIFTYKTWWHMMGPEAYSAMAYKQISRVTLPMLLMRGENDPLIGAWEAEALQRIAQKAGNPFVSIKDIPRAGHDCMENPEAMLQEILNLLRPFR